MFKAEQTKNFKLKGSKERREGGGTCANEQLKIS